MKLVLHGFNLLAKTGVVVTVSGEAAGKPKERMWDRRIKFPFVDTSNAGTREYKADQGAGGTEALNAASFAAGHNLSGATVAFESSPDNAAWTPRASAVPAGTGAFSLKAASLALFTTRYSRVTVTGAATAPSIPEMLFTRAVLLPREVSEPGTRQGRKPNIRVHEASSGLAIGAKRGPTRWWAEYLVRDVQQADRTLLEGVYDDLDGGAQPLLLEDADAVFRWARWVRPDLVFDAVPVYRDDVILEFLEQPS